MKIYLIRHAKVDIIWPKNCNSLEFDNACRAYDKAGITDIGKATIKADFNKIYVSSLYRSRETARRLFPNKEYYKIDVEEVLLISFTGSSFRLPLIMWNVMGRLQWFFNIKRQISRSPSCGVNTIYDGSFSGKLISGKGVFADLLQENGIKVIDVSDL